ncbi:hypothetical protein ACEPAI_6644 [Sanghuangporus weigelae]
MTLVRRSLVTESTKEIFILQYYSLASVVLLYYDHLLTFPMEVRRVWRRRLTLSSVLFLVNRYAVFGGYIFVLYMSFFPPVDNIESRAAVSRVIFSVTFMPSSCKWFCRVGGYLSLLTQIVASILLSLRTYALYNRSWKVLCFVSLLGLSTVITSAWAINGVFGILVSFGLAGGGGDVFRTCVSGHVNHKLFVATVLLSTVFDGVVFLLTVTRTVQIVCQNKKSGARADLPQLLMRDGSIYFSIMIVANLVNVIIFSDKSIPSTEFAQSTGNNAMLSHVISVTMISRLVLNLHGFEERKRKAVIHPHKIPHHVDLHPNGTRLNDMSCEISFTGEEISQDTTQLTTQISVYSTLHTRVMEGFGGGATMYEKNDIFSASPSDANTIIDESISSHSAYSGDEPAWLDEDDDSQQSESSSIPRAGNDLSGVKRFSDGHAVWWAE